MRKQEQAIREPVRWETLRQAAERTGYAYQTFKVWKCQRRLPFPVYVNNLVKPSEVDSWVESTRVGPCLSEIERHRIQ